VRGAAAPCPGLTALGSHTEPPELTSVDERDRIKNRFGLAAVYMAEPGVRGDFCGEPQPSLPENCRRRDCLAPSGRFSIGALIGTGELDRFNTQQSAPLGLIPETVLKRPLRVLFAEVDVDRFRIAVLDKRVQAHGENVFGQARAGKSDELAAFCGS